MKKKTKKKGKEIVFISYDKLSRILDIFKSDRIIFSFDIGYIYRYSLFVFFFFEKLNRIIRLKLHHQQGFKSNNKTIEIHISLCFLFVLLKSKVKSVFGLSSYLMIIFLISCHQRLTGEGCKNMSEKKYICPFE